jgi:predicted nucleic-acid-binding Zn-ribbon protein
MKCLACSNNIFRHHKQSTSSRMRNVVLGEHAGVFGKTVNAFTCYKCGFMMYYSGDISYNSST